MRARLFTPEYVTILPINRAATVTDSLAQEPTAHLDRAAAIRILGQVDETNENARTPGQGGATLPDRVMITFKSTDLVRLGWTPANGDRLSKIEDKDGSNPREKNLYATEAHNLGKMGRRATLVVVSFETRSPRRSVVEGL